jgi:hypothetical protein
MRKHTYRSVNIREDVRHPDRLAHYHPTSRSVPVIAAVLRNAATMVIASYGSGKSLAAGIGVVAAANEPASGQFLAEAAGRIGKVDPGLGEMISERAASGRRGRAVVLSGYVRDLPSAISSALGLGPADTVRKVVKAIRRIEDADRIAIVWDEFGRHLEGLVMDGRSRDLDALQELSELVVRPSGPSISLTLLLHQNVLAYAQSLNQTSRSEWRKVEGRFEQLRFVEDSRELYGLAASIVSSRRSAAVHGAKVIERASQAAIEAGWFDGMDDPAEVRSLVAAAAPLSAAALEVLPRLVARVGQNERSLFAFLERMDLSAPVGMEEVYVAFSDSIRSDVGIGGLHRRWIEAESAMAKAEDEVEREVLAAAFLLNAGVSGERRRLRRAALLGAAVSDGHSPSEAERAVDSLVSRKLLLHRKLNDDMAIWHGADVDVSSRVREERIRIMADFDLHAFLEKEHPAPFVRPGRHNAEKGTSRYLEGRYATPDTLPAGLAEPYAGAWGRVHYVVCATADDVRRALATAATAEGRDVVVVPDEPLSVTDAALEIAALIALRQDERLMSEDPLVGREIEELLAVARRQLAVSLHRLTTPRPSAASWHAMGRRLAVDADRPAGIAVSDLMDGWFPLTPRIVNDQMVRTKVSRQMSTARIRLITRLADNAHKPMLGGSQDDSSAEASIYRTVLARTGIHVERDGAGGFARPDDIADPGLSSAWAAIRAFFTEKGKKSLSDIVSELSEAPVGLAAGVMPVLVFAGYKAFGRAVTIRTDGKYVRDVLGFASTMMFAEPERHEVEVHASKGSLVRYLEDFSYVFTYERPSAFEERVTHAALALEKWLATVADGARRSKRMPANARNLLRAAALAQDPAELILETLPLMLGGDSAVPSERYAETIRQLEAARNAIDGLIEGYLRDAVEVVEEILHLEGSGKTTLEGVHEWVRCFDVDSLIRRRDLKMTDQTILRTARDSMNGRYSDEGLARVISSVLLQRSIDKWQDDTKEILRKELRESRERIEAAALDAESPGEGLVPIIEARIIGLQRMLDRISGQARKGGTK